MGALSCCDAEMCKSHGGTLRAFLALLLLDLGTHADEIQGLLFERPTHGTMFMREEEGGEHAAALKAFLKILQSDNWLAKFFLPVRIEMYAEHTPTPLRMMQDLTESALNFECDIMDAKRTMSEWPELVGVTPPPEQANDSRGMNIMALANTLTDAEIRAMFHHPGLLRRAWLTITRFVLHSFIKEMWVV
jgi:hypothetical protein